MPQQNERVSLGHASDFVSDIDYSEAQTVLDLTSRKQKQLRRQRSPALYTQLLLKRTYIHVCDLLDSDCCSSSQRKTLPLSTIDTNKRKLSSTTTTIDEKSVSKKTKISSDLAHDNEDILQFLRELNAVKVAARY